MESKKNKLIITLYSGFLVAASWLFMYAKYPCIGFSNDEMTLKSIASVSRDAHLVYMLYPLGLCLQFLYTVLGSIPWFDLLLVGLHLLCWFFLLLRVGFLQKTLKQSLFLQTLVFVGIFLLDLENVIHPQYTILAAWLAGVSIFYLLSGGSAILGIFLAIISLWVRKQVFFLALPLLLVSITYRILQDYPKKAIGKDNLRKLFTLYGALFFACVLSLFVDTLGYSNDDWRNFLQYNKYRTMIYDYYGYADYTLSEALYQSMGISENDFEALNAYDISLVPEMNLENLKTMALSSKEQKEQWRGKQYFMGLSEKIFQNLIAPETSLIAITLYILALLSLVLFCIRKKNIKAFLTLFTLLFHFAFIAFFTYKDRLPQRVLFSVFFIELCFILGLFLMEKPVKIQDKALRYSIISFALLLLSLTTMARLYGGISLRKENELQALNWKLLIEYCESNPDNIYYIDTEILTGSISPVFDASYLPPSNLLSLGIWTLNSPLYQQKLDELGINNPLASLAQKDDIYFVQRDYKNYIWLQNILSENGYDTEISVEDTLILPSGYPLSILRISNKK